MSEIDLSQDPSDFADLAMGNGPADPQGQPKDPAETPAAGQPAVPHQGTPGNTPKQPEPETNPESEPNPADPKGQPTDPEKIKEQANAAQKITELGQERARLFKTQLALVQKNPDIIKDIYNEDSKLADQIVKEHWGHDSYDELMQYARIQELKESDPQQAEKEEKLLRLEKDNKTILSQLHSSTENAFYASKGIKPNSYDPNYQAVQEALKKVSPDLVRGNYAEALEIAHTIAFPGKTPEQIESDKKKLALATGMGAPMGQGVGAPSKTPQTSYSPAQQDFMGKLGINT